MGFATACSANEDGNHVVSSVRAFSTRVAPLLRWEKLFNGFVDPRREDARTHFGGVISDEKAAIRVGRICRDVSCEQIPVE